MNTPFGPPFSELTLDDLKRFFLDPQIETLTWEAKGDLITDDDVRDGVCGFANGFLDGYLVLGASSPRHKRQDPSKYTLNGWVPKGGGEPDTWISDCLRHGIDPRPFWDPKSWPVSDSLWVTVVQVRPVPVPPCITIQGKVLERLPGLTSQVNTSEALRALFSRGYAATENARGLSHGATHDVWMAFGRGARPLITVGLAAPALEQDISSVLFRDSTRSALLERVREYDRAPVMPEPRTEISQDSLTIWNTDQTLILRIDRRGAVAIGASDGWGNDGLPSMSQTGHVFLTRLWATANSIAREVLKAYGPSYVSIRASDYYGVQIVANVDITRSSSIDTGPSEREVKSVAREAARRKGQGAWEPEPGSPPSEP